MGRPECCPSPWPDATPAMARLNQVQQPWAACARQQLSQLPGTIRQHYHSLAGLAAGNIDQDGHPQHLAEHQQLRLAAPKGGCHDAPAVAVEWWESRGWGAGGAWGQLLRAQTRTGAAAPPRPGQPPGPGHTSTRHNQPQAEQAGTTTPLQSHCPPASLLQLVLRLHRIHRRRKLVAARGGAAQRLRHRQPQLVCKADVRAGWRLRLAAACRTSLSSSVIDAECCCRLKGAEDQQDAWYSQQQQSSSEHATHPPPAPRLPGPGSGPGCAPAPAPAPCNGGKNCKVRTSNAWLPMGRKAPVG